MPMYDRKCPNCGVETIDCLEPVNAPAPICPCGTETERVWLSKPPAAVGDECDVTIRHGLCHPDGSPQRFTSKAEIARQAKARGLVNMVRHQGTSGGDRNKHTTRWV